jgi:aspartokinase
MYRLAGGTLITPARDMADALVTCIVLKPHVTLMDIVSTKMLGQFGFLVRGF